MVLRRVLKFHIECDGYKPNGRACPCEVTVEGYSQSDAEARAKQYGWREDHRGWLCNAREDAATTTANQLHSAKLFGSTERK